MTDSEREQERLYVAALLASFVSFQRCGPASALETDWSAITQGRPVVDCRVSDLRLNATTARPVLRLVK
jgi:hypothetical protein